MKFPLYLLAKIQLAKEDIEVVKSHIVTSRRNDYEVMKLQFATLNKSRNI